MEDRRIVRFRNFAQTTLKNPKYAHWFPANNNLRTGRYTKVYLEEKAVGDRLYKSPLFALRRCINQTEDKLDTDLTGIF